MIETKRVVLLASGDVIRINACDFDAAKHGPAPERRARPRPAPPPPPQPAWHRRATAPPVLGALEVEKLPPAAPPAANPQPVPVEYASLGPVGARRAHCLATGGSWRG